LLKGNGSGGFTSVPYAQSGFLADKDARKLAILNASSSKPLIVVGNNDDVVQLFRVNAGSNAF